MPDNINGIPFKWDEESDKNILKYLFPVGINWSVVDGTANIAFPTADNPYISNFAVSGFNEMVFVNLDEATLGLIEKGEINQERETNSNKINIYVAINNFNNENDFTVAVASGALNGGVLEQIPDILKKVTYVIIISRIKKLTPLNEPNKKEYTYKLTVSAKAKEQFDYAKDDLYSKGISDISNITNIPNVEIKKLFDALYGKAVVKKDETPKPCNPNASKETQKLFEFLINLKNNNQTLFGHQDTFISGRSGNWQNSVITDNLIDGMPSDIYYTTGDYPALFAWDIGYIERYAFSALLTDANSLTTLNIDLINDVKLNDLVKYIKAVHRSGGINTISWHLQRPKNKFKNQQEDNKFVVSEKYILHNAVNIEASTEHQYLLKAFDIAALFFKLLVDDKGEPIPIIFRPFHEVKADNKSFWWSNFDKDYTNEVNESAAKNYRKVWNLLQTTLQTKHGINNLLYSFCFNDEFIKADYKDGLVTTYKTKVGFEQGIQPWLEKLFEPSTKTKDYGPTLEYDLIGFDAYQRLSDEENIVNKNYILKDYFEHKKTWYTKAAQLKFSKETFLERMEMQTTLLEKYAHNKIFTLAEFGADFMNFDNNWFNNIVQATLNKLNNKPSLINFWRNAERPMIYNVGGNNFLVNEYYVPFANPRYYYATKEEEIKDKDNKQKNYTIGKYENEDFKKNSDSRYDFYADYDESYITNFRNWLSGNNKIVLLNSLKQLKADYEKQKNSK